MRWQTPSNTCSSRFGVNTSYYQLLEAVQSARCLLGAAIPASMYTNGIVYHQMMHTTVLFTLTM